MRTTLQEQLDWLDEAREAEADPGFLGRMLALCSLPRTNQGGYARSRLRDPMGKLFSCAISLH